ncbi:MAG: hypothetical protein ACKOUS_10360, partial [Alphaproteobacteria bacterium]
PMRNAARRRRSRGALHSASGTPLELDAAAYSPLPWTVKDGRRGPESTTLARHCIDAPAPLGY